MLSHDHNTGINATCPVLDGAQCDFVSLAEGGNHSHNNQAREYGKNTSAYG